MSDNNANEVKEVPEVIVDPEAGKDNGSNKDAGKDQNDKQKQKPEDNKH